MRDVRSTLLAGQGVTRAATSFKRIQEVAEVFKLQWTDVLLVGDSDPHSWKIEEGAVKKPHFNSLEKIQPLLYHYQQNFSQKGGAVCRTAIDMILLKVLKDLKGDGKLDTMGNEMPHAPTLNSFSDVAAHREADFKQLLTTKTITVTGRIHFGIGRKLPSDTASRTRFQSLVLVVEAKADGYVDSALPQLLVYLASIRQSREARGRSDTSVYGVASDGFIWRFVMITRSGLIKLSRQFNIITRESTKLILECLAFMMETAASMSPSTTPKKGEHAVEVGQGDLYDRGLSVDKSHDDDELLDM